MHALSAIVCHKMGKNNKKDNLQTYLPQKDMVASLDLSNGGAQ